MTAARTGEQGLAVTSPATSPRRRRGLWAFLASEVVSVTGTRMSMVAIPWFVLITTGSPALTGLVAFAETLPYVVVLGLGGPLVDRWGARRVAVGSDVAAAVLVGAVPLLHLAGRLPLGVLVTLVALAGAVRGLGTATYVLMPGLAERPASDRARDRAPRRHEPRGGDGRAALAGVLMTVWSAPAVLLVDAASFLVAGVLIALLVDRSVEPSKAEGAEDEEKVGYVAELREGFAFLRGDRLLVAIALMVLVTNLLDQAYSVVLVPVWVRDELGSPLGLGLIGGIFGVGAVTGSALFAWLGPRLPGGSRSRGASSWRAPRGSP